MMDVYLHLRLKSSFCVSSINLPPCPFGASPLSRVDFPLGGLAAFWSGSPLGELAAEQTEGGGMR